MIYIWNIDIRELPGVDLEKSPKRQISNKALVKSGFLIDLNFSLISKEVFKLSSILVIVRRLWVYYFQLWWIYFWC